MMTQVTLKVSLESLAEAIVLLTTEEKQQLRQLLDNAIAGEKSDQPEPETDSSWSEFMEFVEHHAVETGITDFARQHDHYIHGTPKQEQPAG
jgi:hypothetical protein